MKNTAEIRKNNLNHVLQLMSDGREYTVKLVSERTGLCAATCCTAMKILTERNLIVRAKRQLCEVGRPSDVYRINDEYDSILSIQCIDGVNKRIAGMVNYLYGGARITSMTPCSDFGEAAVTECIDKLFVSCGGIVLIQVGLPHYERAKAEELRRRLAAKYGAEVCVLCDCDFIACGAWEESGRLIAFADYTDPSRPDFYGVRSGEVVANRNARAFDVGGFIGEGNSPDDLGQIIRAVSVLISMLSPDEIIFTGGAVRGKTEEIRQGCKKYIPDLPVFTYRESLAVLYNTGMARNARKLRGEV